MLLEYLSQYSVLLVELIGLLILTFISAHLPKREIMLVRITIALLFVQSIVTFLELWTDITFETYTVARPILTGFKYSLYPCMLLMMTRIIAPIKKVPKWKLGLSHIPLGIGIILFFTTQWTKVICYYDEVNIYHRGTFFFLPYVFGGLYLLIFMVQHLINLKHQNNINRVIVLFIVFGSIVSVIIQILTDASGDYTYIFASGMLLYYIFRYINIATKDPLTGIYNRQSYYKDLYSDLEHITAIVSVDMNKLKYINDKYGHNAGDEALKIVSKVILENIGSEGKVYRIGGDEFIIIYESISETIVKSRIGLMKSELDKTGFSCAFGYAMNDKKTNIDELVIKADENMYKDKEKVKRVE